MNKEIIPAPTFPQKISELKFTFLSAEDIRKMSAVNVNAHEFYTAGSFKPSSNGVLDLRLGGTTDEYQCQTCGGSKEDCPGHFGSIDLVLPVYNIGFYHSIIHILRCICKTCSHVLLPNEEIETRLKKLYHVSLPTVHSKIERMKILMADCEKVKVCPHCGSFNGPIRETKSILFISHFIGHKQETIREQFLQKVQKVSVKNIDLTHWFPNCMDDITPLRCYQLFDNIPIKHIPLLISGTNVAKPSDMIIRSMIVPPTCIRPPVISLGEGTNQDDLTIRLFDAVGYNNELKNLIEAGKIPMNYFDIWNSLQQTVTAFINSDSKDISSKKKKKDKPIIELFKIERKTRKIQNEFIRETSKF